MCVDGNIADVSGAVLRWLESSVIEECKHFEPKVVIFVLITKSDLMQPEKIENVAKIMDDYVSSGFCSTWALVSAKKMTGQTPINGFPRFPPFVHLLEWQMLKR